MPGWSRAVGSFRLRRCGIDDLDGDGGAERVGEAKLIHPVLRPIVGLVVLADLDEDCVPPRLERRRGDVRVLLEALVVSLACEDFAAVEPDLESRGTRGADFNGPRGGRVDDHVTV